MIRAKVHKTNQRIANFSLEKTGNSIDFKDVCM